MRGDKITGSLLRVCMGAAFLLLSCTLARSQEPTTQATPTPPHADAAPDVRALADAIRNLQAQVQTLSSQVSELRADEQRWHAEARELHSELELTRAQLNSHADALSYAASSTSPEKFQTLAPNPNANSNSPETMQVAPQETVQERLAKLEDNQDLLDAKINEQSQTKVESSSKYRVRLSGILLLNLFDTRGPVDNVDFPQMAVPPAFGNSSNAFAATIRQSQIGLEVFGPEIAGARTSANVKFDFAGGFTDLPNGVSTGVARLRTGTIRMDWANTSIVAGQDSLFFAPLTPTSLSSLAIPPLAYAGNLWSWTPQVRIEHRKDLSEASSLLLQAGILDSLTGDIPTQGYRYPTAGEQSGQPAYAGRIAWNHHLFERNFTAGAGGYYGRQNWGFGRDVDGWAATADISVPLGRLFAVTGEFYRGRAVGGLAGGVGQDILLSGLVSDPATNIRGLDSIGGWTQLKFKPTAKFEVNAALGIDNPFASELRRFPDTQFYYGYSVSRNLSPFINFIYQVRSDVLFSVEYKRIQTYTLNSNFNAANQFGISIGYIF
ncbi:MAG: hypothetical protein WCD49_07740 [Candidatus Acidiferrales bacterium]